MAMNPKGGDDVVYTPDALALHIVTHFAPTGRCLEPCRGGGAFERAMPGCDWFEIQEGRDFLAIQAGHWDWIVTNPPWSKLRAFLQKSMAHSDNVVFLCNLNALMLKARLRDVAHAGFGIKEFLLVETPPKPWPQSGFQLGAIHLSRGYSGPITFSNA